MTMFEKFIYNIINTTGFVFFNFRIASLTSSRDNGRLICSFSPVMTGLYNRGTVPEKRGSLFSSRK